MIPIEVRFRSGPAKAWFIVMVGLAIPFIFTMTVVIVRLLGWIMWHNTGAGALAGMIAIAAPTTVVMVWANVVFVRMAACTWRYGVRSEVALRADDEGIHARELVRGRFRSLTWDQVGTIGAAPMGVLYVEAADVGSWVQTLPWWRRWSMRSFRRRHGYLPALSCGLPVDRPLTELMDELARMRDERQGEAEGEMGADH